MLFIDCFRVNVIVVLHISGSCLLIMICFLVIPPPTPTQIRQPCINVSYYRAPTTNLCFNQFVLLQTVIEDGQCINILPAITPDLISLRVNISGGVDYMVTYYNNFNCLGTTTIIDTQPDTCTTLDIFNANAYLILLEPTNCPVDPCLPICEQARSDLGLCISRAREDYDLCLESCANQPNPGQCVDDRCNPGLDQALRGCELECERELMGCLNSCPTFCIT